MPCIFTISFILGLSYNWLQGYLFLYTLIVINISSRRKFCNIPDYIDGMAAPPGPSEEYLRIFLTNHLDRFENEPVPGPLAVGTICYRGIFRTHIFIQNFLLCSNLYGGDIQLLYIRILPSHQYNLECCKNFCMKINVLLSVYEKVCHPEFLQKN